MKEKWIVVTVMFLLLISAVAYGQAKPDMVIEAGTFHPPGTGDVEGLQYFKKIVEERSNGKIQVNVYYGGTLGDEKSTIDQARLGTLHVVIDGMATMGAYASKYSAWTIPYAYPDKETLLRSVKGPIGQAVGKAFERNGLIFGGIFSLGYRELTANKKVVNPADLKGLKLRLPSNKDWIVVWKEFGVLPTPIPAPEIYLALQTGTVDAQENPFTTIHVRKLWEVQKYVNLTHHVVDFHLSVISKKFMDRIPEQYKGLVLKALEETMTWCGQFAEELEKKYIEEARSKGMELVEVDGNAYRKIALGALDKIKGQWEPWVYDQLVKETLK